jgi:hypothetical protein
MAKVTTTRWECDKCEYTNLDGVGFATVRSFYKSALDASGNRTEELEAVAEFCHKCSAEMLQELISLVPGIAGSNFIHKHARKHRVRYE